MQEPVYDLAYGADNKKRVIDTILLLFVPAMLLMSFIAQFLGGDSYVSLYGWNSLLVEGLVIFLPAYIYMKKHGGLSAFGFVRVSAREFVLSLIMGVGIFFFVTAVNALFAVLWVIIGLPQSSTPVPTDTSLEILLSLLFVAAVPAIAEETLFRGALFRSHTRYGVKRAMLHTSLMFALAHFQLTALPALFAAGLLFTYTSRLTGSVYSSMAMHFSYNATAVVISALARGVAVAAGQAAELQADDLLGEFGQFTQFEGLAATIIIISALMALVMYAGLSFGIGYPSYRGLVRATARRLDLNMAGAPFREVKAAVISHMDGVNAQAEPDAPCNSPDTGAIAPKLEQTGLGWRAALSYVLMGGLSLLFLLINFVL